MSDSDLVLKIETFDIDLEEEVGDQPLPYRTSTSEPRETTGKQLTEQEAGMKQEETKEEEFKVNIKQEILDEPEDRETVERGGYGASLARRQYIYRRQRRDRGAKPRTREQAEENQDGEVKHKRKADNETGEGGSGEGESGQLTSGESPSAKGASKEKKVKIEEPSDVENDDSSSDWFVVLD